MRCQETEIWTEYIISAHIIIRRNIFGIYFRICAQSKKYYLFNIFRVDRNNNYFRYNCADVISSLAHIRGSLQTPKIPARWILQPPPGQRYRRCRSIYRGSRLTNIFTRLKAFTRRILGACTFLICFRRIGPVVPVLCARLQRGLSRRT